ncbi:MAG: histidinol dehydrogenase [Deltaproteobacteria bacterium]|nr:histidinol dehydrogenase [Deltaproteobacteria bacterium]
MTTLLARLTPDALPERGSGAVDDATIAAARLIVDDVRARGEEALRAHAERLGDVVAGAPLVIDRAGLEAAWQALPEADRELLARTTARIRTFAEAQRASLRDAVIHVPGGQAGHTVCPLAKAGCYAPGGRFPLPSSVLMTVVTARAAGVEEVWVASPRPAPITLAAAHVAGADGLLAVGGAQAVAALAYGAGVVPACDIVVGPGNRWVTAAKKIVSGDVAIDMLAGPSELVVLADGTADADIIAADLLAQAEHDPDAVPILVTTDATLADRVDAALASQLETLSTAATARAALTNGAAVVAPDLDAAILAVNRLAPEHLEVMIADPWSVAARLQHYGGLFLGTNAAEVLGDYGAGPNHVLPTGRTARYTGGLSVMDFLRVRTWLEVTDRQAARELVLDAAALARHEGLEAHARAAEKRLT